MHHIDDGCQVVRVSLLAGRESSVTLREATATRSSQRGEQRNLVASRLTPGVALPLFLSPRVDPIVQSALEQVSLLTQLTNAMGSPLGVVLPQRLTENVAAFRSVYSGHRLAGQI